MSKIYYLEIDEGAWYNSDAVKLSRDDYPFIIYDQEKEFTIQLVRLNTTTAPPTP
jgi:hypothetical protein